MSNCGATVERLKHNLSQQLDVTADLRAENRRLRGQRDRLLEACDQAVACLQGECPGTARRVLLAASIAAKEDK